MLIRHSAIYVVARLCPGIFGVLTTAALTRLLEPGQYGIYALALVIMTLGSTICFDWLNTSFLRFYQARRADPQLVGTFIAMFVVVAFLAALGFGGAWISGVMAAGGAGIAIVGLILVWTSSWFELVSRFAIAEFRPLNCLFMNLGRSVLILVGACGGAWLTGSPIWAAIGTAAAIFAAAFVFRGPIVRPTWRRFDWNLARAVLKFGAPIAASSTLFAMSSSGSRLLIAHLDSASALGFYTAASVLVQNTLGVIGASVASAGYSLAVRALEQKKPEMVRSQLLANGNLLLAILAPASLGLALIGNCLATTVVGPKFAAAVAELVPWMAATSFFVGIISNYLEHSFHLGLRPHLQMFVTFWIAVIAIGICIFEIPREGPLGAAIAMTVASAVGCVLAAVAGRRAYPLPLPINGGIRVAAACGLMALIVIALPDRGWEGLVLRAGVGSAVYSIAAIGLNVANVQEHFIQFTKWVTLRRPAAAVPGDADSTAVVSVEQRGGGAA
jgi:O-antigen/teichoic acid export membrane protein